MKKTTNPDRKPIGKCFVCGEHAYKRAEISKSKLRNELEHAVGRKIKKADACDPPPQSKYARSRHPVVGLCYRHYRRIGQYGRVYKDRARALSDEQVEYVRAQIKKGVPATELAKELGVSPFTIYMRNQIPYSERERDPL